MQNESPKPGVPGKTSQWPHFENPAALGPGEGGTLGSERIQTSVHYRRADREIERDIRLHLDGSDRIDASEISVQVSDGSVTLTGFVRTPDEKALAHDIVWAEPGVVHCSNGLILS